MESTISELGNIFKNLATVVQEQGETLQRIDDVRSCTAHHFDSPSLPPSLLPSRCSGLSLGLYSSLVFKSITTCFIWHFA